MASMMNLTTISGSLKQSGWCIVADKIKKNADVSVTDGFLSVKHIDSGANITVKGGAKFEAQGNFPKRNPFANMPGFHFSGNTTFIDVATDNVDCYLKVKGNVGDDVTINCPDGDVTIVGNVGNNVTIHSKHKVTLQGNIGNNVMVNGVKQTSSHNKANELTEQNESKQNTTNNINNLLSHSNSKNQDVYANAIKARAEAMKQHDQAMKAHAAALAQAQSQIKKAQAASQLVEQKGQTTNSNNADLTITHIHHTDGSTTFNYSGTVFGRALGPNSHTFVNGIEQHSNDPVDHIYEDEKQNQKSKFN